MMSSLTRTCWWMSLAVLLGAAAPRDVPMSASFEEIDRLAAEQKYQAAAEMAATLAATARQAADEEAWLRARVLEAQLRIALGGVETAVGLLRQAELPAEPRRRAILDLFYAQALVEYQQIYSWEIRQRERRAGGEPGPIDTWTAEQIANEVHQAYLRVWEQRESWGEDSLSELATYFEPNDYPGRIRGTMRDTVVYLWAAFLGDTTHWSPGQSNGLHRLDLERLLQAPAATSPADPAAHPLERLAFLLTEHEAWHRAGGRPEAAFEARRVLDDQLRRELTRTEDGERLAADLERALGALGRSYPWWSMGMWTLAQWERQSDAPEALVLARERALAGYQAHPSSPGGERCRRLVAEVEAPDYGVEAMASDGAGKRSIEVTHRNLPRLWFRAWKLDLEAEIAAADGRPPLSDSRRAEQLVARRAPTEAWDMELAETPDYRAHRSFVTPPLEAPGLYLVAASATPGFGRENNHLRAFTFVLGDLVMLSRQSGRSLEVTVRSGASGRAVAGVRVEARALDRESEGGVLAAATTDRWGGVVLDPGHEKRFFLVARQGEQVALDPSYYHSWERAPRREETNSLVYTDRSIYRPGQELLWKVLHFAGEGEEGRFAALPGAELTVELVDPNGEVVASSEATTNEFGTASGAFEVPAGRLLGQWTIRTDDGASSIAVEEYKRPTFEVTLDEPERALRLNREAELAGEARYYFGLPVVSGEVAWRATREPVYPRWWFWMPPATSELVAAGEAALDETGRFRITFTPEADERDADRKGVSYRYRLEVDVTGEGGETRSASRVFRLGFVAVEAAVEPESLFFETGGLTPVTVRRWDLDGTPRAGTGTYRLVRLRAPGEVLLPADLPPEEAVGFQTEGDALRPRWNTSYDPLQVLAGWEDGEQVAAGQLAHGDDGEAKLELGAIGAGAYRLRYLTRDEFGAEAEARAEFLVVGDEPLDLPLAGLLLVERASVVVGETIRLLAHSGLADQPIELEIYRSGQRLERRRLESGAGPAVLEIPVSAKHRGGLAFRWTALRDHQLVQLTEQVFVPWSDRELSVEFATFRDRLEPGARETWRVTVRGEEGSLARGSAELLAYMYDRSLDFFAGHDPADPLLAYPRTASLGSLTDSLGSAPNLWLRSSGFDRPPPVHGLRGDRPKFFDAYGIGGPGRRFLMRHQAATSMPRSAMAMEDLEMAETVAAPAQLLAEAKQAAEGGAMPPGEEVPPPEPVELRSDFSETAFWEPHLLLGDDGSVSFEFETPDSVTDWNVWVHAVTADLRAGSAHRTAKTVKELLVRPYLPRFLREGDRAELRVVVNNAGERRLAGRLDFELTDPASGESVLEEFGLAPGSAEGVDLEVAPGQSTELTFEVTAPARVGQVEVRVTARTGDLSDGEARPLPLLPSRVHLAQSRFVALRGDSDSRTLHFADLAADDDPSRVDERLVVTLDGQLFYGVLRALPYLIDYPYDCTEQLLNRFVSTGVVSSLFDDYPAVAQMAKQFSSRETVFEAWDADDPNRRMALEETPWLAEARGGPSGDDLPAGFELIQVLDPEIARATRDQALAKLRKAQAASGGFPWWPGGPPSPYMTIYLLQGLSRALEHGVEVPRDMVEAAWSYVHGYYVDDLVRESIGKDCCWERVTLLNYVLSSYPDPGWTGGVFSPRERERMLDFSFKHWREHAPLLKAALALTLHRAGRAGEAKLVLDSVMDSAKTDDQLGTYWAPEARSWLWYNDTIETHAYILRALSELDPGDARRHGLVQWLFLNKKLNHWKSTRATAEVVYALAHYLAAEGTLGGREEATVRLGSWERRFTFEPDRYGPAVEHGEVLAGPAAAEGRPNQIVVPGEAVEPAMATVRVEKPTPGALFASATWHFSTERLPERGEGDFFHVERAYYKRVLAGDEWTLEPLAEGATVEVGDQLEVQLSLRTKHAAEYVHLRDPRGAGFEPESHTSGYQWDLGIYWYQEVRDSGANFFFEWLPAGEYTFKYRLRAATAGTFRVGPATIQPMYAPEFNAYSSGAVLWVE